MDIETALATMRQWMAHIRSIENAEHRDIDYAAVAEIADQFEAIDEWLSKGGFLPAAWKSARPTPLG